MFAFVLGRVGAVNTAHNQLDIDGVNDEHGEQIVAPRSVGYTQMILCVGSLCNDFGTKGGVEHCLLLDTRKQAERFHTQFIHQLHRLYDTQNSDGRVMILEAAPRILGQLPERDSHSVTNELEKMGVEVRANTMVSAVTTRPISTSNGSHVLLIVVPYAPSRDSWLECYLAHHTRRPYLQSHARRY